MAESLNIQVRKKIGENIKKLLQAQGTKTELRELDAQTGKDYKWIGKILNGDQNFTIDSLFGILQNFELQFSDVFDFAVDYKKNVIKKNG